MTNNLRFIFPLQAPESIEYLRVHFNVDVTLADFYKLVLTLFVPAYIKLFEPEKAFRGRYISFTKTEHSQLLKKNIDKRLGKFLKSISSNQFGFDEKLNQNYCLSNKKTYIAGIYKLPMLGNEAKHISNLYIHATRTKTRTINEKKGHVFLSKGKKIFKLINTKHMKWHNNYSTLSDFSHELVFKQKDLDKLAEFLVNRQTDHDQPSEQTSTVQKKNLVVGLARSYRIMINALLSCQGIKLGSEDASFELNQLIICNNFKLPNEVMHNCKKLLMAGTLSADILQSVNEEELLILLSSLINQGRDLDKKSQIKEIMQALDTDDDSQKLEKKTISKYVKKISSLDTSKYSYKQLI